MSSLPARRRWKHPLLALVLPAVLLGLGVWQLTRVAGAAAAFDARAQRVQTSIDRIQPLATRDPTAIVRFNDNSRSYTASEALQLMQGARTDLVRDAWIDWARTGAAWVAIGGGAIALLSGLCGLVAATAGARRGRQSRDTLVTAFRRVVRVLPLLLGGVAVGTAAGVVGATLFEVGGAWFLESINVGEVKLILIGLALAAFMVLFAIGSVRQLRRALDAFTPHPMRVLGREASPSDAPGLWTFLREVATRQGAAAPDHIVLGLTEGFFVTSADVLIAPEQRVLTGRTLHLPATYLPLLSHAETAAVLAHELAHFTGEDTRYSQHFLPLFASMSRTLDAVTDRKRVQSTAEGVFQPAALLASHVLETFQHTVSHWSRLREFEADRAGARFGGGGNEGRAAATALLRTGMGGTLIGTTLRDLYERPARADDDVVGTILARAGAVGFTDPDRHLEDRQPHPTDTHPPTRQRIEALHIPIDPALLAEASRPVQLADARFAGSLFADWPGFRRQLGHDLVALARQRDQQWQASLEARAAAVTDEIAFQERTRLVALATGIPGVIFILVGLCSIWLGLASSWVHGGEAITVAGTGAVLIVMGVLFLMLARSRHRRGQSGPFLRIGPDGFTCIGLPTPVSWADIDGIQVTVGQAFLTTFRLAAGSNLPEPTAHRWTVKLDRRKRTLTLKGLVPYKVKPQDYLNQLNGALNAYRARQLLQRRAAEAN